MNKINIPSPESGSRYWRKNICRLGVILTVWFSVSFGCGILWRDWLDANFHPVGHAPFGFWMAQQGSIICFVLILIAYTALMNRMDVQCGFSKDSKEGGDS